MLYQKGLLMLHTSCMLSSTNCEKKFEAVILNRMTVQRRVVEASKDVDSFSRDFNKCVYYSLGLDEPTDIASN